ncbi:MAG: glucose-6-phosphate dehydrogenase assembly protein OpcA [Chlamydiia bacterium]|nr:glucose-6-phosphate dehydrogenase assembly protein OpcA [Chlamydiia bacterium]
MVETIHPADIESELERIWDSLQGTNKMRACLFNLIIYAKKCQRVGYLNQIAQKVIEKFPSRIIFITYDDTCSSHDLKTSVSVMTADEGEYEIACDLIEVEVCKKDHPRVPFVILPHILPDLPIYLVHADDPTYENPVAEALEHLADRIIFDSEAASNLPSFSKAVLSHDQRCGADIADLNWARTEGWRQLFANVFKSPEELEKIRQTRQIKLTYNHAQETDYICHTNIQSIYFQAWVAVQLGWTFKSVDTKENTLTFHYESEFGAVESKIMPGALDAVPPGRILSVEVKTHQDLRYQFMRKQECPHHVMIEKSSPQLCSLPTNFVLDKDVSGQSLVKEICHKGTSMHYTKVLTFLSEIENACLCNE